MKLAPEPAFSLRGCMVCVQPLGIGAIGEAAGTRPVDAAAVPILLAIACLACLENSLRRSVQRWVLVQHDLSFVQNGDSRPVSARVCQLPLDRM